MRQQGGFLARSRKTIQAVSLYLLFALTGIGLVLPGTLLPLLVSRWGWHDGRSGGLFFIFFVGTTLGAQCARGMFGRVLLLGAVAVAMPLAVLASVRGGLVPIAMLLVGFGLGLLMTGISLLRSRQVPYRRALELTRLNLAWALGAAFAPLILLRSQRSFSLSGTLCAYGLAVLLCGTAAVLPHRHEPVSVRAVRSAPQAAHSLPVIFAAGLPLATGIEAGVGGWLVTYALREHATYAQTITAGTALWAGLLVSRTLFSATARLNHSRYGTSACAGVLVFGLLLLIWSYGSPLTIAGAFFTGFGVGPLYPQLLAGWLSRGEAENAGFLLAGAGSALLPFLIGQISQRTHSLRIGLALPFLGSLVLFAILLRVRQAVPSPTSG